MDGPHLVCEGPAIGEGPVWCVPREGHDDGDGTLVFTGSAAGVLSRVQPATGVVELVADTAGGANGAAAASDGGFLVTQNGGIDFDAIGFPGMPPYRPVPSGLQRVAPDGTVSYVVSGTTQKPNDLCVHADGTVFFTDPPAPRPTGPPTARIQKLPPGGQLEVVADGFFYANGIILEPDGESLVIVEAGEASGTPCFVRLRADGSREPFAFGRHGDGGALDADGRIYMAGGGPIVSIYEADGTLVEELHLPEGVRITTNLCFGGADLRTLFVTDLGAPCHVFAWTGMPTAGLPLHAWPVA
ncbi:MAG: SMP-30/gluconolactonase/LRE family protein [Acidimicrobiia bacterium]